MADLFHQPAPDANGVTRGRFAQVALERGLETPEGLTYTIPDELADLAVGDRVLVPLGKRDRPVSGFILELADRTDLDPLKLKAVISRQRHAVNLPDDLVALAKWMSQYYCCPLGMVFATMLPAAVKHGTGLVRRKYVKLHDPIAVESLESIRTLHGLRGKQVDVLYKAVELDRLGRLPIDLQSLAHEAGAKSTSPVIALIEKGLLSEQTKVQVKAVWAEYAVEPAKDLKLNDDQQRAVDALTAPLRGETANRFKVHLLHGVTGSGKTEVYIRAIEPCVEAGRTAIVLVPEISLTPQTVGRFIGRFKHVAVLHSGLTAAQRHEQWSLIRAGWANVVVGARSAVFAPVKNLGLIIVDEEHDAGYKQDQAPRYHGRDVAIKRAQMLGAAVVLGSATPSLESYYNAVIRRTYKLIDLPKRVSDIPLPNVEIVDMTQERRKRYEMTGSAGVHLLSIRLETVLRQTFKEGGQAMLLLNRRGFANYIACPDQKCGWMMRCDHCDVQMVYHLDAALPKGGLVRCHYCGLESLLPQSCPACGKHVTIFGLGTQRVEKEIEKKFPNIRMIRMDSDAMRTGRDYAVSLAQFRGGEVDLLVGTQMIAKGLDFPNVRLVGVISADTALNLPDFRASERTFQLVAQVAGRSGRAAAGGRVIVQTFTPDNPAIRLASKHDYTGFAMMELDLRKRMNLPPITRMARIVVRDENFEKCRQAAKELHAAVERANEQLNLGVKVIGPMSPPIARIAGYHRQQIELIADDAVMLQHLLTAVRHEDHIKSDAHTAVDVDPVSLL